MVAILMAAVLGSGLSTLLLAKFGIMVALLAMPLAGSAAGLVAALGLAAAEGAAPAEADRPADSAVRDHPLHDRPMTLRSAGASSRLAW